MRKAILLTAAAAFLAVPAVVQAQTGTVNASATVEAWFNVVEDANLDFGEIAPGDDADGSAFLDIEHNAEVALDDVSVPTVLTLGDGEPTIDVAFTCAYSGNDVSAAPAASGCDQLGDIAYNGGFQVTRLWVVGNIAGGANTQVQNGVYTGKVEFTFSVNN